MYDITRNFFSEITHSVKRIFSFLFHKLFIIGTPILFLLFIVAPIQQTSFLSYNSIMGIKIGLSLLFIIQFMFSTYIKNQIIKSPLVYYIVFFSFWLLISSFFSYSISTSFQYFFRIIVIFLLFFAFQQYFEKNRKIYPFINILGIIGIVYSFIGIREFIIYNIRASSIFLNPNSLGGFTAIFSITSLSFLFFKKQKSNFEKILHILCFTISFICLYFSLSRSGWVFFFISLMTLICFKFKKKAIYVIISLIVCSSLIYFNFKETIDTLLRIESGLNFRQVIWGISYRVFKDNTIFGIGLGCLEKVKRVYFYTNDPMTKARVLGIQFSAHSEFLQALSETGLVGLVLYLALLFKTGFILISNLVRKERFNRFINITSLSLFIGLFGRSFFEGTFLFGSFSISLFFWALLASANANVTYKC